jgi:hypothetical protein
MNTDEQRRLDELLPWYVNGRIAADDRAWVQSLTQRDPNAKRALDWHAGLKQSIASHTDALPGDAGLSKLMARVTADAASPNLTRRAVAPSPAAISIERVGQWLSNFLSRPSMAAFATALIVLQAGVIGGFALRDARDLSDTRSVNPKPAVVYKEALRVSFRSEATERGIRSLLTQLQARLADGPTQQGDYVLLVPADKAAAVKQELEASPIVDSVAILRGWTPNEARP